MAASETSSASYCAHVATLPADSVHRNYHDTQYGFPVHSDDELFGRLILEINQAGLSWTTILNKQANFKKAFDGYRIARIAAYDAKDVARLLGDAGIVRNRAKIAAVIYNAQQVEALQMEFGSFKDWLNEQGNLELDQWVRRFKRTFKFTGGEITREFLVSTGYLPGAHATDCPIALIAEQAATNHNRTQPEA